MKFFLILVFCFMFGLTHAQASGLGIWERALFVSAGVIELALTGLSAKGVAYKTCKKPICSLDERKICCIPDSVAGDGHRVAGRCQEFPASVFNGHCGPSLPVCEKGYEWYCQSGTDPVSVYSNATRPTETEHDSNIPGGYPAYQAALAGVIISPIFFVVTMWLFGCAEEHAFRSRKT